MALRGGFASSAVVVLVAFENFELAVCTYIWLIRPFMEVRCRASHARVCSVYIRQSVYIRGRKHQLPFAGA